MKLLPLARWLSSIVLHASLFFVIFSIVFVTVIANKQALKDSLVTSGAYSSFVETVIDANTNASNQTLSSLPFSDKNVRQIVIDSFSPQFLKSQTDAAIDDVYTWLQQDSKQLTFRYDFTQPKTSMNNALASYAADRVMSLPPCEQVPEEVNVFTVSCRPVNITHEFVRVQTVNDLNTSDLLKDPIIDQDDLPKTVDGKTLDQKYSFIPRLYTLMKLALPVSIVFFTVSSAVYIFFRRPVYKGLRAFGRDLLSNGLMLILLTVVFGYIIPKYTNSYGVSGNKTAALFNKVSDSYIHRIDILVINIAIQLAAAGFGLLLILRINKSTSIYSNLKKKSGLATSIGKSNQPAKRSNRPPVQTSEASLKPRNRTTVSASKKYRGAKW